MSKFSESHLRNLRLAHANRRGTERAIPWNKGIPWPSETKKKISDTQRSKKISGMSGTEDGERLRRHRISLSKSGKPVPWATGKNHWNWRGGVQFYGRDFKLARPNILNRDEYTCQMCLKTNNDTRIVVHHIDGDASNNCWDNLVTLCGGCNSRAEARNNKGVWPNIFNRYIENARFSDFN